MLLFWYITLKHYIREETSFIFIFYLIMCHLDMAQIINESLIFCLNYSIYSAFEK